LRGGLFSTDQAISNFFWGDTTMRRLTTGPVLAVGILFFTAASAVPQPHMESALAALEQAKHEVEIADQYKDHGGHAGAATGLIEQAIHELREGIRYRDEHPH
jgi:hypothetical protein